jgi:DNA-binding FadR family transcriptional regulator
LELEARTAGQRRAVPKAAELVADELRSAIARGELTAEQRLPPQPELAELFGVSAPTMREALRILETEGLIRVQRGIKGGAIVQRPGLDAMSRQLGIFLQMSGATIADAYAARRVIEPGAVRLLAAHYTAEAQAALETTVDALEAALDDPAELAAHGARFHLLLIEHSGSAALAAVGSLITDLVERQTRAIAERLDKDVLRKGGVRGVGHFRKLLDHLKSGDGPAAENYWRDHIQDQLEFLERRALAHQPLTVR